MSECWVHCKCEAVCSAFVKWQVGSYLAFVLVTIKAFICGLSQLPQWSLSTLNLYPLLWQLVWFQSAFKSTAVSLCFARMVQTCQYIDENQANLFLSSKNVIELRRLAGFTGLNYYAFWIKTMQNLTLWQLEFPLIKKRERELVAWVTICTASSRTCRSLLKVLGLCRTGLHKSADFRLRLNSCTGFYMWLRGWLYWVVF